MIVRKVSDIDVIAISMQILVLCAFLGLLVRVAPVRGIIVVDMMEGAHRVLAVVPAAAVSCETEHLLWKESTTISGTQIAEQIR